MTDDNGMLKLILSKQDETLREVSAIKQFMAGQEVRNKHIEENREDIKEMKKDVAVLSADVSVLKDFRRGFRKVVFEVLRAPLAATGIVLFVSIGLALWILK